MLNPQKQLPRSRKHLRPGSRPCVGRFAYDANGNQLTDGLRKFDYNSENRHSKTGINDSDEGAKALYLYNALGQRVFKSEPQVDYTAPNETALGTDFISWLKTNFKWLFATAQSNASLGSSYAYADAGLPTWALLGEYNNGAATGSGRTEYIWLPLEDGSALPIAMFRNNRYWNIHSDHLGTPRYVTDDAGKPVWQLSYSAFVDNKPSGVLAATTNPNQAITAAPLLKATAPAAVLNLRFPGQYFDSETNLNYNYYRTYQPTQGRYTQFDPIGLAGGPNGYLYANGAPTMFTDPMGLDATIWWPGPNRSYTDSPRNGNWGGGKWSGGVAGGGTGRAPHVDSGDACYMRHDQCYDSGQSKKTCDRNLVEELKRLPDDPRKWAMPPMPGTEEDTIQYRKGAISIFGR